MDRFGLVPLFLLCLSWVEPIGAQGFPQPSPNAKACAYLPVAELEAHFGTKAKNLQGIDQSTRNTCTARFPDPFHVASIESHPSAAADLAMTAAHRLAVVKGAMKKEMVDTKDFGTVGCLQSTVDLGKPVRNTTCFLANAPYLALTIQSIEPAQVSYDAVKSFLEKAAARRK